MSSIDREIEKQLKVIKSRSEEIIPEEELRNKLRKSIEEGKPLKVKFGIDPTGSEMHVGHAVPLRKLKQFQQLGHSIDLLIGSFTAKIGDPTGKSETRKVLSDEDIQKNCETYLDQASLILDIDKINLHYNGDWLSKLHFEDLLKIMSHFSLSLMISREDFANRLKQHLPISLVELTYPLMQAYDSVHLKSDIEIGGTDQKFNLLRGRDLQRSFGQTPQICLTLPILEGTNGKDKMSKSLNNYISIREDHKNMFGKVMSIPDEYIYRYYELVTEFNEKELENIKSKINNGNIKPYEAKKMLGEEIVTLYHNKDKAIEAKEHFNTLFSKKEIPDEIEEIDVKKDTKVIDFISSYSRISKSDARRLINSNAVKHDGVVVDKIDTSVKDGILKFGKRKIVKISIK